MKKKQTKAQKANYQKFFPLIIFISIIFMSVGYAIINSVILNLEGEIVAKPADGIYITEIKYSTSNNANINDSTIKSAYETMLNSEISLSKTDATSSITYEVKIYNSSNNTYYFDGIKYYDSQDTYSNKDIIITTDVPLDKPIAPLETQIFYITYSYKDGVLSTNNTLSSVINFEFTDMICPRDGRVCDRSGNENHLIVASATWNKEEGIISTNGSTDYMYIENLDWRGTSEFTIEFDAQIMKNRGIMFESSINSNNHYGSFYMNTGEYGTWDINLAMKFNKSTSNKLVNHQMVDNFIDSTQFHHYVVTLNTFNDASVYIKMYKDGVYYATTKVNVAIGNISGLTLENYPFYIASRAGASSFQKMNLKLVRVYTKELTAEEVLNNYNGTNITQEDLIIHYNFK